ncbi:hypothetical protein ACJMK2_002863 [Sinanodonta woodiana]|uniref:Uncharacterized protein n=1 Tax=Sinanodonta woodiana TaxID=1069815 RepID=A0ABD3XYC2_SINWO
MENIRFVSGNEGFNIHKQTLLSKINRGELKEIQENSNNGKDREGHITGSVACQFEDVNHCGYINHQPGAEWDERSGDFFKIPQYDHTYGNVTGHFMVAYNSKDLLEYYKIYWINDFTYPARLDYQSAILSSPSEHFTTESCVYFYYYLNGTANRPNPYSAQLLVYVNSSSEKRLAWYDRVNRTVTDWLKGWVSVSPGDISIVFEGKTLTATTVWPGVVALDDMSVISEPCPVYPDCGPDTFQCTTTRVCIPVDMQCDGGKDCVDGSDEENCTTTADYQVKLINGDGSYGSIAIFYKGLWRPVCMNDNSLMEGDINLVELVCNKLCFHGRFHGAFANSWHQPVEHAMKVSCSRNYVDLSSCSMTLTETNKRTRSCYYYQAALCSHDECFSGERICPKDMTNTNIRSRRKCISTSYFCDGIPDCQGGTDELNCAECTASQFECNNHVCVPASQRCDGIPQCGDKSDEYGCVIVANSVTQIYHSDLSTYLPVCYNDMNKSLADILCSLTGRGAATHYEAYTDGQGIVLTRQSTSASSIVPGYDVSVGSCKSAIINCTSFECGTTIFDDSRLQKIFHGRDAVLGQFPWLVAIYKNREYYCGGFIIHPNWILTAAHCILDQDTYRVRVGEIQVDQNIPSGNHNWFYTVSRSHSHHSYNAKSDNDIGLLYINPPIAFNDYVRPICIASKRTVEEMLNAGHDAECYASGWGNYHNFINRDEWLGRLQIVRVYLYQKDECDQRYTQINWSPPQNNTVCVDNQNPGSPTCHSDSGGPLICRNKYGRFEVLGPLSWGYISCFKDGYPDVYQLAYIHECWIEQYTECYPVFGKSVYLTFNDTSYLLCTKL